MEAFETAPYRLMRYTVFGTARDGRSLARSVASVNHRLSPQRAAISSRQRAINRDGVDRNAPRLSDYRETYDIILSQLWSLGDGQKKVARKKEYRDLNTASNEAINSWLPERSGVLPYLRAKVRLVLQHLSKTLDEREYLKQVKYGKAKVVLDKASHSKRTRDIRDHTFDEESSRFLASRVDALDASAGEAAGEQKIDDSLRGIIKHGDWPLRFIFPEYNKAEDAQSLPSMKYYAKNALTILADMDTDFRADLEIVLDILNKWDGKTSLVSTLPELADATMRYRYEISGYGGAKFLYLPKEPATLANHSKKGRKRKEDPNQMTLFEMLSPDFATPPEIAKPELHVHGSTPAQIASFTSMIAEYQGRRKGNDREQSAGLFSAETPAPMASTRNVDSTLAYSDIPASELASPFRPDYIYLCGQVGVEHAIVYGSALAKRIKKLATQYFENMPESNARELLLWRISKWDPAAEPLAHALDVFQDIEHLWKAPQPQADDMPFS